MARALVIHHDHVSSAGYVGERLTQRGWDLDEMLVVPGDRYDTPDVEPHFPDPAGYELILPLGAPWSVTAGYAWTTEELRLLRTAHEAGIPVFGICFGGQALAAALGGSVEVSPRFELGPCELDTDAPELLPPGPWFQFHGDRWTLPPGVREVARNDVASQAFVAGRSLGVQFHPELTADGLQAWFDHEGEEIAARLGLDAARLVRDLRADHGPARARAHALVDAFLERVAGA